MISTEEKILLVHTFEHVVHSTMTHLIVTYKRKSESGYFQIQTYITTITYEDVSCLFRLTDNDKLDTVY